jgi:hypothetical protein
VTVTDAGGRQVTFTSTYTTTFPGTTLPAGMYWFAGLPGGGNSAYTWWPVNAGGTSTLGYVNNGLYLPLTTTNPGGSGVPTGPDLVYSAGVGMTSTYALGVPRMADWVVKFNYAFINGVVNYFLEYPSGGTNPEVDYWECLSGTPQGTYHPTAGVSTHQAGPTALSGYNLNAQTWMYVRTVTTANGAQTWVGPNATSLTLVWQKTLAEIQAAGSGGGYTIPTNVTQQFDTADWCSTNVASLVGVGPLTRQVAGLQLYS